jgi:hypothetical protein
VSTVFVLVEKSWRTERPAWIREMLMEAWWKTYLQGADADDQMGQFAVEETALDGVAAARVSDDGSILEVVEEWKHEMVDE